MIQLLGSGFGQNGSTLNFGGSAACAVVTNNRADSVAIHFIGFFSLNLFLRVSLVVLDASIRVAGFGVTVRPSFLFLVKISPPKGSRLARPRPAFCQTPA